MSNRSDDITAKALSLARHPGWEQRGAMAAMRPVVEGDVRSLELALARIRRFLAERPGEVGERAFFTLQALFVERTRATRAAGAEPVARVTGRSRSARQPPVGAPRG